jgi:hypothetical protein
MTPHRPCLASALILTVALLAGCASQQSPDPQAKEDKAAAAEAAKETGAIDDARCQSYGFQPGSPRYAQCRKDIDSERKQTGIKE